MIADLNLGKERERFKIQRHVEEKGRNSVWSHTTDLYYTLTSRSSPSSVVLFSMRLGKNGFPWRKDDSDTELESRRGVAILQASPDDFDMPPLSSATLEN